MKPAWLLLQLVNSGLVGFSAYAFYFAPGLWFDQAQLYFCLAGIGLGCLTSLVAGFALLFQADGFSTGMHGLLGLIFAIVQAYWLFHFGLETGMMEFFRRTLHLGSFGIL